jgi:prepilin-type N-terminal cleavage/methylation domain-containing protein
MNPSYHASLTPGPAAWTRSRGFTLVELLTVIAIISLLIGILVPSVSKARDSAKNARTRAIMKNMGDGLELFVNENSAELRGQNYPSSRAGDDPTESGNNIDIGSEDMSGAQWVVRYLMGKRLDGYVQRKVVPPVFFDPVPAEGSEQVGWYDNPGDSTWPSGAPDQPLPRSGPYLEPGAVKLKAPRDLAGYQSASHGTGLRVENPVIVDSFEMPILYYAANSLQAARVNANITSYGDDPSNSALLGIYTFRDNALFTGLCNAEGCHPNAPPWDFGGGTGHQLNYGPTAWTTNPSQIRTEIGQYPTSFPYFILNREAWESSSPDAAKRALVPNRKDSFILLSPGKDGLFGTGDDVTNF